MFVGPLQQLGQTEIINSNRNTNDRNATFGGESPTTREWKYQRGEIRAIYKISARGTTLARRKNPAGDCETPGGAAGIEPGEAGASPLFSYIA